MKYAVCFMILLLSGINPLVSQGLTDDQRNEIQNYISNQVTEGAPGLAYGIIIDGKIVMEEYTGLSNLQDEVDVTQQTRFNIASVAKQFTALCILTLAKEGKLSVDDDFREYLPDYFPAIDQPILIRHLITHTSGIRDVYDLMSIQGDPWWRREGLNNKKALAMIRKQNDLNFVPGTDHLYSNSNYLLLTELVATVSGDSFIDFSEQLFMSLGMESSAFNQDYMVVIPHVALPYNDWGDGKWKQYPFMNDLHGDGFLYTTLGDLLTYEVAVQESAGSNNILDKNQHPIPGNAYEEYGYGVEIGPRLNYPSVYHSGSTGSYHAEIVRFPSEKLSIVVMSNNGNLWSGFITEKIAGVLLPKKESLLTPEIYSKGAKLSKESLLGEYMSSKNSILRVIKENNELFLKQANNNPIPLELTDGNVYQWKNQPDQRIRFIQNGEVIVLEYYNGTKDAYNFTKMPPFQLDENYLKEFAGIYRSDELDVAFELSLAPDLTLRFTNEQFADGKDLEIIQRDAFLLYDYIIRPEYDEGGHLQALLITYNRVKNVKFSKKAMELNN